MENKRSNRRVPLSGVDNRNGKICKRGHSLGRDSHGHCLICRTEKDRDKRSMVRAEVKNYKFRGYNFL